MNLVIGLLCCLVFSSAQAANKVYMNKAIECFDAKDTSEEPEAVLNIGVDYNYFHELYQCEVNDELTRTCQIYLNDSKVAVTLSSNDVLDTAEGYDTFTLSTEAQISEMLSTVRSTSNTRIGSKRVTIDLSLATPSPEDEEDFGLIGKMSYSYNKEGKKVTKSVDLKCDNNLKSYLGGD